MENENIFWNSFFNFKSKNEIENFDFRFLKSVLNQNRFKKIFFRFTFLYSIIKIEKWKKFFKFVFSFEIKKRNTALQFSFCKICFKSKHEKMFLSDLPIHHFASVCWNILSKKQKEFYRNIFWTKIFNISVFLFFLVKIFGRSSRKKMILSTS